MGERWIGISFAKQLFLLSVLSTASSVADAKANLTKITWAHAVNDAEFLTRVLASK